MEICLGDSFVLTTRFMNEPNDPVESQTIPEYPMRSLVLAIVATVMAPGTLLIAASCSLYGTKETRSYVIPMRELQSEITYYDALLTHSAMIFAATGRQEWEQRYKDAEVALDAKLAVIGRLARDDVIKKSVTATDAVNLRMVALEQRAMKLARSGSHEAAMEIFNSNDYISLKKAYARELDNIKTAINEERYAQLKRQEQLIIASLLLGGIAGVIILPVAWTRLARAQREWRTALASNMNRIQHAKQKLATLNDELVTALDESMKQRARVALLSEMGGILHSCLTSEEVFKAMEGYCERLFPDSRGAVYRLAPSRDVLEEVARWNDPASASAVFSASECWALRRGSLHAAGAQGVTVCPHVQSRGEDVTDTLCIPLIAQNMTLGLFYLQPGAPSGVNDSMRDLASAAVEQIALAVSNIELRNSLREQSIRDQLTGLYNRRYLEATLEREIIRAARQARPFCIISFDVDHFKRFNDSFGHDAGDKVLRSVGRLLQNTFRGSDVVCRMGGEEFVVLLPDAGLSGALVRAEDVRAAVAALEMEDAGRNLGAITISAGIAEFSRHGESMNELLKAADAALYRAKSAGRNHIEVACKEMLVAGQA